MTVPAEVEPADARPRDVDLLPRALADVADPQVAGRAVEAKPPRVAQAGQPDLGLGARRSRRTGCPAGSCTAVAGRGSRRRCAGSWPAACRALAVALRVAAGAAVAERDVEHAVRPEHDAAAVVVGEGLVDLAGSWPRCRRIAPRPGRPGRPRTTRRPCRRPGRCSRRRTAGRSGSGMEREPEQAALAAARDPVGDVEERARRRASRRARSGSGRPARRRRVGRSRRPASATSTGDRRPPTTTLTSGTTPGGSNGPTARSPTSSAGRAGDRRGARGPRARPGSGGRAVDWPGRSARARATARATGRGDETIGREQSTTDEQASIDASRDRRSGSVVTGGRWYPARGSPPRPERSDMDAWEFDEVEAARADGGRLYHEFLRVPDLSAGLYVLEAGATDPQSPHTEDELYFVIVGRGLVTVGGETRPVVPGRWSSWRPASRTASTTSTSASSCWSCSGPPRGSRRGCPSRRPRPAISRNAERQLRATAGLVVAEEDERIVAGRQERLEPGGPGGELGRRRSRAGEAAGTGTARSGAGSAAPCPRAARSRTARRRRPPARRTSRRRARTGPGTPSSGAGRAATRRAARPASRRRA